MQGLNITDCRAASAWLTPNTGGLARTEVYIGYSPSTALVPGDFALTDYITASPGTWPAGGMTQGSGLDIFQSTTGTNQMNATPTSPQGMEGREVNVSLSGQSQLWDVFGLNSQIFNGGTIPSGTVNRLLAFVGQSASFNASGSSCSFGAGGTCMHAGLNAEYYASPPTMPAGQLVFNGTATITSCGASSCSVTLSSGDNFYPVSAALPFTINGIVYIYQSWVNPTHMAFMCNGIFSACPGAGGPFPYSVPGRQYSILMQGNQRYTCLNPSENVSPLCTADASGGGGMMFDVVSAGDVNQNIWIRDMSGQEADGTYDRKMISVGGGSGGHFRLFDKTGLNNLFDLSDTGVTTLKTVTISTAVTGDGTGLKHKRFPAPLGGSCPTGTSVGNVCVSANLAWTTAFADNNYTVTCSLDSPVNQPHIVSINKLAAGVGITIAIATDLASAANAGAECIAMHD